MGNEHGKLLDDLSIKLKTFIKDLCGDDHVHKADIIIFAMDKNKNNYKISISIQDNDIIEIKESNNNLYIIKK